MKRLNLLSAAADETKKTSVFASKVAREKENLKFEIVKLQNECSQLEDKIEDRLSSEEPVTPNDVKLLYSPISKKKEEIRDLENFIKEYYSETN